MLTDDEFHFTFILFAANIYQIILKTKKNMRKFIKNIKNLIKVIFLLKHQMKEAASITSKAT